MTNYNCSFERTFPFSNITGQLALAANSALPYTVPGDNSITYRLKFAFAYNANVWVGYNVTATVPTAATVTSNSNIELARTDEAKYVRGGDILSFISNSIVSDFGFSLLRLPG